MAAGSGGFSSAVSVGVGAAYSAIKSAGQAERVAVGSNKEAAQESGSDGAVRTALKAGSGTPSAGSGTAAQKRIDAEYKSLGFDWGKAPKYDKNTPAFGATDEHGVRIGSRALQKTSDLRSTLVHEGKHVDQLGHGNYARTDLGGHVNEAEAYREELLNVDRTGMSESDQLFIAGEYRKELLSIESYGSAGQYYLRNILIYESFALRPQDSYMGPIPTWIKK